MSVKTGITKLAFLLAIATAWQCNITVQTGDDQATIKAKTVSSEDGLGLTGAVIKNNIDIEATGTKLKAAYLMDANNQYKSDNTATINEKIILTIETDTGWVKTNGQSFIGASEKILAKDGTVVLDAPDLFADYDAEGLPSDIAKTINLTAIIDNVQPGYEDFTVQYRVWDKKGTGEIKGSYKFTIKP
jgi:hypothetical protein